MKYVKNTCYVASNKIHRAHSRAFLSHCVWQRGSAPTHATESVSEMGHMEYVLYPLIRLSFHRQLLAYDMYCELWLSKFVSISCLFFSFLLLVGPFFFLFLHWKSLWTRASCPCRNSSARCVSNQIRLIATRPFPIRFQRRRVAVKEKNAYAGKWKLTSHLGVTYDIFFFLHKKWVCFATIGASQLVTAFYRCPNSSHFRLSVTILDRTNLLSPSAADNQIAKSIYI